VDGAGFGHRLMVSRRVEKLLDGEGMGLALTGEYQLAIDESIALFEGAAMAAADQVAQWGKDKLRGEVTPALGPKVARTIRSVVYPDNRGQTSLGPSVVWWSKAPHILSAFTEAQTIRAKSGKYLAIPTENAPKRGRAIDSDGNVRRGRAALLAETEKRFGKLRHVPMKGKNFSMLVVDKLRKGRGKRGGYRLATPAALRRRDYENSVVMFILVPEIRTRKMLNLDGVTEEIASRGFEEFVRAFTDVVQRNFAIGDNA